MLVERVESFLYVTSNAVYLSIIEDLDTVRRSAISSMSQCLRTCSSCSFEPPRLGEAVPKCCAAVRKALGNLDIKEG